MYLRFGRLLSSWGKNDESVRGRPLPSATIFTDSLWAWDVILRYFSKSTRYAGQEVTINRSESDASRRTFNPTLKLQSIVHTHAHFIYPHEQRCHRTKLTTREKVQSLPKEILLIDKMFTSLFLISSFVLCVLAAVACLRVCYSQLLLLLLFPRVSREGSLILLRNSEFNVKRYQFTTGKMPNIRVDCQLCHFNSLLLMSCFLLYFVIYILLECNNIILFLYSKP